MNTNNLITQGWTFQVSDSAGIFKATLRFYKRIIKIKTFFLDSELADICLRLLFSSHIQFIHSLILQARGCCSKRKIPAAGPIFKKLFGYYSDLITFLVTDLSLVSVRHIVNWEKLIKVDWMPWVRLTEFRSRRHKVSSGGVGRSLAYINRALRHYCDIAW